MRKQRIAVSMLVAGGLLSPLAHATNGMNLSGYGPIAESMGGASMAYDNGTAAVMNNPATLGLMQEGTRADVALGVLAPDINASTPGMPTAGSEASAFYMPAIGAARKSGKFTFGATVFSQGGMGTEYAANSFLAAGSGEKVRSEVGVGRFILPLAYQADDNISIGGSLDFVWAGMDLKMAMPGMMAQGPGSFQDMVSTFGGTQTFGTASGSLVDTLQAGFAPGGACGASACLSSVNWARVDFSDAGQFTGQAKGHGFAFKLGGTYKVSSRLTLGASYHSKTALGDLKTTGASMSMNLTGAAFGGGSATVPVTGSVSVHNFQWPQTFAVGAAYQANDQLLLVADFKRIGWKDVMKDFSMTFTADAASGMGGLSVDMTLKQNWKDQNVVELGGAFKATDAVTVRAGVNLANNPVPDFYMNPLFPAIARNHGSAGLGYAFSKASSLDLSYVYVPKMTATNGMGTTVDFGGYSGQVMFSLFY